jgi:nicotinate-nucleotide adenylyltransferase
MVRIATAGHPAFEVSELEAQGTGPHYSYQTLETVRRERPGDDLFFLIGADSLADLPTWRNPERIAELATIVVVNRPGIDREGLPSPPDFGPDARPIIPVTVPPIGIASKDLRRRIAERQSIRYQVPRGVEAYIEAQGLYLARRS